MKKKQQPQTDTLTNQENLSTGGPRGYVPESHLFEDRDYPTLLQRVVFASSTTVGSSEGKVKFLPQGEDGTCTMKREVVGVKYAEVGVFLKNGLKSGR